MVLRAPENIKAGLRLVQYETLLSSTDKLPNICPLCLFIPYNLSSHAQRLREWDSALLESIPYPFVMERKKHYTPYRQEMLKLFSFPMREGIFSPL
jgi:hypothetical protein